jgi:sialic acid synthase SpsE
MGINFFKVLSWDINDHNYIDKLIETGKRVYISTGLATENNLKSLSKRYGNNHHINLIHTQLTHEVIDTNLKAIELMKQYGFDVSYGNHSKNLNTIYVSLPYQPKEIWCYVKLKNSPQQPLDYEHAIEISNINKFIENIIELKKSIGDGKKIKHETKAFNAGLEDIL